MIISLTMGIILAILAGLVLGALLFFIIRALKGGPKAAGISAFTVGLIGGTFLFMSAGRIVVVHDYDDAGTFLVYGSPTYEFSNGYKLSLTMESLEGYVINDSELELVLEQVIYSTGYVMNEDYDILIRPMSITQMPGMGVHYFFEDVPPDEIQLSQDTDSESRYWLRTRESYEEEYGITVYDTSAPSISANKHSSSNEN